MKLQILIATVEERKEIFNQLLRRFTDQILANDLVGKVGLLAKSDNKEMSIGRKRQLLLEEAVAEWIVFFDDDDYPYDHYVSTIYKAIQDNTSDCVGFPIDMITDGRNPQRCCHSLKYPLWRNKVDGWDFVRNITHFNPVKREKALLSGFKDMRFGEDKDYSDRLYPILSKEFYISNPVFLYRYSTKTPHKIKYGIK